MTTECVKTCALEGSTRFKLYNPKHFQNTIEKSVIKSKFYNNNIHET